MDLNRALNLFLGMAITALVVLLVWRIAPPTPATAPAPTDSNGNPDLGLNTTGPAFLTANMPLAYPPPISFMTLQPTSARGPT